MVITEELQELFRKCRTYLGAPVVEVELTDEQLCDLLQTAQEDYSSEVLNFVTESSWINLYGKNVTTSELTFMLSTRGFEMVKDFSDWFSRNAGQQARGKYELKKDFIKLEAGKQVYLVPKGREIRKVLWLEPPTTMAALFANYYGAYDFSFGMGAGYYGLDAGGAMGGFGYGGYGLGQAIDTAWRATDMTYKRRLLRGDLVYKVTALETGEKLIHLYSTPGSKLTFGAHAAGAPLSLCGCHVWYEYYDVDREDADECKKLDPDVLLMPNQVPLKNLDYTLLNGPAKTTVRNLFFANALRTLAFIRGKWSGTINIMEATAQLDYQTLISQADKLRDDALKELRERLQRLLPVNIMKQQAELTDAMSKVLGGTPLFTIMV